MIVDLFAGPGGWSEGLRMLGLADIGIELDAAACATRAAAGHATIRADVETYPAERFRGAEGLIASPPCQDFSAAGSGAGRAGVTGRLIDTVPAWVQAVRPRWVACEQVPPCLPIWQEHAHLYGAWGYQAWCGILNAADYGVPQTRRRAFLIASLDGPVLPPEPTHCRGGADTLLGPLEPWVSMAQALGWVGANVDRPAHPDHDGTHGRMVLVAGKQALPNDRTRPRAADQPAPTIAFGHDVAGWAWVLNRRQQTPGVPVPDVPADHPAPTLTGIAGAKGQWVWERPATTVAGDPRITARCHHDDGTQGADAKTTEQVRQGDYDGTQPIRLTIAEALVLQSFPPDYPVQGGKTKQFEQVGNAVPPLLAAHVIAAATGRALEAAA